MTPPMDAAMGWYAPAGEPPSDEWTPEGSDPSSDGSGSEGSIEARPIVTAIVCEVVDRPSGWTLPEGSPSPAQQGLETVRSLLTAGGGRVQDLVGAPLGAAAVFGPGPADDDGPLRAIASAASVTKSLAALGVSARCGVATLGVPTDDVAPSGRDPVAEVIDLAVGLQARAEPGEILVTDEVCRHTGESVEVEAVEDAEDGYGLRAFRVLTAPELALGVTGLATPPDGDEGEGPEATWADVQPEAATGSSDALGSTDEDEPESVDAEVAGPGAEAEPRAGEPRLGEPGVGEPEPVAESGLEPEPEPDAEPDREPDPEPDPEPERDATPDDEAVASTALIAREDVFVTLRAALDGTIEGRGPVVVGVLGEPGSGRTAVTQWFAAEAAERAVVVSVSCRPAAMGGTGWPFVQIARALAGVAGVRRPQGLDSLLAGDAAPMLPGTALREIVRFLTDTARQIPVLVIVDDADRPPGFAEVLAAALAGIEDAPILSLLVGVSCGTNVEVGPLGDAQAAELVERLLAHPNLPPDAITAIVASCHGNPLAVEHLVAMLADDGHLRWEYGRWVPTVDLASLPLPAELRALLGARIGGLPADERKLAAVAAIAVPGFGAAKLADALDETLGPQVDALCASLTERGILRRLDPEDGQARFAFTHDLLREIASSYAEHGAAARMHEHAARWLEDEGDGADAAEAIGAHLEAALLSSELPGESRAELSRRAARHLSAAGRLAADLGNEEASLALLRRAAATLPAGDPSRSELLIDSALALVARHDFAAAERLLADAVRAARAADDGTTEARAAIMRALVVARSAPTEEALESLRDAADAAVSVAGPAGDDATLAWAWFARGWVHRARGYSAGASEAFQRSADRAAAAGRPPDQASALRELTDVIADGPAPIVEALERCERVLERARGTGAVEHLCAATLAVLRARTNQIEEARALIGSILEVEETLERADRATVLRRAAAVERLAGSPEAAEIHLWRAIDEVAGDARIGAAIRAELAALAIERGQVDEAETLANAAASDAAEDDAATQVMWRAALARCRSAEGRHGDARALIRQALRRADQTDLTELRAVARMHATEILLAAGRGNEARPAARAAVRALERKGAVASLARARGLLARVAGRPARDPSAATTVGARTRDGAGDGARDAQATPERADGEPAGAVSSLDGGAPGGAASAPESEPDVEPERRERRWFW